MRRKIIIFMGAIIYFAFISNFLYSEQTKEEQKIEKEPTKVPLKQTYPIKPAPPLPPKRKPIPPAPSKWLPPERPKPLSEEQIKKLKNIRELRELEKKLKGIPEEVKKKLEAQKPGRFEKLKERFELAKVKAGAQLSEISQDVKKTVKSIVEDFKKAKEERFGLKRKPKLEKIGEPTEVKIKKYSKEEFEKEFSPKPKAIKIGEPTEVKKGIGFEELSKKRRKEQEEKFLEHKILEELKKEEQAASIQKRETPPPLPQKPQQIREQRALEHFLRQAPPVRPAPLPPQEEAEESGYQPEEQAPYTSPVVREDYEQPITTPVTTIAEPTQEPVQAPKFLEKLPEKVVPAQKKLPSRFRGYQRVTSPEQSTTVPEA
ncbi:MAG: hypothetical protein WC436_02430 [Candidatus Babeliales bacterium]